MMGGASVNKVILLGRLGQDPEIRQTGSGKSVGNFSLATDGQGESAKTEWHRIIVWDRLADQCGQYLRKGRQVFIEGRIQTREWEDRDGNKRQTTEIVAYSVQFLADGGGSESGRGRDEPPPPGDDGYLGGRQSRESSTGGGGAQAAPGGGGYGDDKEDVPF
jgi:single-strand DNA-binding protein